MGQKIKLFLFFRKNLVFRIYNPKLDFLFHILNENPEIRAQVSKNVYTKNLNYAKTFPYFSPIDLAILVYWNYL